MNKNTLIKLHNDINKIDVDDQHLLNVMLWGVNRLRDLGERNVVLKFDEVKEVAELPRNIRNDRFYEFIEKFKETLGASLVVNIVKPDGGIIEGQVAIFTSIWVDRDEQTLSFSMNHELLHLNNRLERNYFAFEARDYWGKGTSLSQRLFLLLSEYKFLGERVITREDLVRKLNISDSYNPSKIRSRVLDPVTEELAADFPKLKYREVRRGRAVIKYKFTWDKDYQIDKKNLEIAQKTARS